MVEDIRALKEKYERSSKFGISLTLNAFFMYTLYIIVPKVSVLLFHHFGQ